MKKYTLHINGTHCASCKILVEDILNEQDYIKKSHVDLKKEIVDIEADTEKNTEEIISDINNKLNKNGYSVSLEKKESVEESDNTAWYAIPIGLVILALFFLLQRSGILNFGISGEVTPVTSFIIGLVASVSSCLVIVGGLVLSLSAKEAEVAEGSGNKPFFLFHAGRLIGFALFGGILGLIGKAIGINFVFSSILGLIASVVMVLLGLSLLGIFKKHKITLPGNIFNFFRKIEHATITPIVIGIGTFFLPCGFTQSMQIASLSSGSFISGLLIMFFFALGTLPVLALLSFGSMPFAHSKNSSLFFKSAGVVIIGFGAISLVAGLTSLGIIDPIFNL